ncbi:hypothetical protein [Myxosarcina sp. GI1(2024)]
MIGKFQQSHLRIEIEAQAEAIRDSLLVGEQLKQWMWPQRFTSLPSRLKAGENFSSFLGFIEIEHRVDLVEDNCLRLLLSKGIDGYHQWYWGEGWIQSQLEGISIFPLNLAQSFSLLRLRQYLASR